MGRWYTPTEWVRKFMPKKDLRQTCLEMYGEDFVRKYDTVNMGIPVGNLEETKEFLAKFEAAKMELQDETEIQG